MVVCALLGCNEGKVALDPEQGNERELPLPSYEQHSPNTLLALCTTSWHCVRHESARSPAHASRAWTRRPVHSDVPSALWTRSRSDAEMPYREHPGSLRAPATWSLGGVSHCQCIHAQILRLWPKASKVPHGNATSSIRRLISRHVSEARRTHQPDKQYMCIDISSDLRSRKLQLGAIYCWHSHLIGAQSNN